MFFFIAFFDPAEISKAVDSARCQRFITRWRAYRQLLAVRPISLQETFGGTPKFVPLVHRANHQTDGAPKSPPYVFHRRACESSALRASHYTQVPGF